MVSGTPPTETARFQPMAEVRESRSIKGGSVDVTCAFAALPQSATAGIVSRGEPLRMRVTIQNTSKQRTPAKPNKHNTCTRVALRIQNVWQVGSAEHMKDRAERDRVNVAPEISVLKEYSFRPTGTPNSGDGFQATFPLAPGHSFRADLR
jgi:hypothetical protein